MIKNSITAKQAREISEEPTNVLKKIYSAIREAADEGYISANYDFTSISGETLMDIVAHLSQNGFNVTVTIPNENTEVQWEIGDEIKKDIEFCILKIKW